MTKRKATQDTGHARRSSPREAEAKKKHQDELLDEALKLTFPASDPIAVDTDETMTPTGKPRRREKV